MLWNEREVDTGGSILMVASKQGANEQIGSKRANIMMAKDDVIKKKRHLR
jgi:hypothetical protein